MREILFQIENQNAKQAEEFLQNETASWPIVVHLVVQFVPVLFVVLKRMERLVKK